MAKPPSDFSEPIGVRLRPDDRLVLERIAASDQRPVSTLIRKIVTDWAAQQRSLQMMRSMAPAPAMKSAKQRPRTAA